MKTENLLWIIILELAVLIGGLYYAGVTAQNAVAGSPIGKIGTALSDLGL